MNYTRIICEDYFPSKKLRRKIAVPNKTQIQKLYIDLFSGCGGLALGMSQAGWKALFAVEKNQDAFKTLRVNLIENHNHFCWPKWLPQTVHDINELLASYQKELRKISGKVSLVAGGPPCQGFSMAGRRKEDDARNLLVDSYLDFIDIVAPDSILFENVKGFTQTFHNEMKGTGKNYSKYILSELEKRQYHVAYKMLNFSDYGVPQRRVRFILFASKTFDPYDFFKILETNVDFFLKQKKSFKGISIQEALSDLEKKHGTTFCPDSKGFLSGKYGSPQNNFQRYCRNGARKGQVPDSHRFANHKRETEDRFKELLALNIRNANISKLLCEKYDIKKNCFSVLDPQKPAPTLTSNPDDHIHYCEPRILTVREYARIQSFPDWYVFRGKYTTGGESRKRDVPRYTQIGNAIPPLFAEQIGHALNKLFDME